MLKLCTWSATHWNETAFLGDENAVNHSFRSTCSKGCRKVSICVDGELSPVKSSLQVDMVQFRCHLAIVAAFVVAFVASAASHSSRLQVVWCGMAAWFYFDAVASSPSLQLDNNGPKEGRPRPTRFQDFPNVLSNDFCWFLSTASSDGHWDTLCVCHSVEMVPEDDTDALEPGMAECWRAPWSNIESYQERVLDANEMRPLSPMKSGEVSPSMETNRLPNSNVQFIPRKQPFLHRWWFQVNHAWQPSEAGTIFWQCHVLTDHLAASWFHNLPILGRNEMHGHAHTAASINCPNPTLCPSQNPIYTVLPMSYLQIFDISDVCSATFDHLWPSLTISFSVAQYGPMVCWGAYGGLPLLLASSAKVAGSASWRRTISSFNPNYTWPREASYVVRLHSVYGCMWCICIYIHYIT